MILLRFSVYNQIILSYAQFDVKKCFGIVIYGTDIYIKIMKSREPGEGFKIKIVWKRYGIGRTPDKFSAKFKSDNGHCNVASSCSWDPDLGKWTCSHRKGLLSKKRVQFDQHNIWNLNGLVWILKFFPGFRHSD